MHQKCFDPPGHGCLERLEIDISWWIRDLVLHSAGRSESPDLLEPLSAKKKQIKTYLPLYYSLLDRFHSLYIKWLLKALEMSDMKCSWFINGVCCRLWALLCFLEICISIIIIKCTALPTNTHITIGIANYTDWMLVSRREVVVIKYSTSFHLSLKLEYILSL